MRTPTPTCAGMRLLNKQLDGRSGTEKPAVESCRISARARSWWTDRIALSRNHSSLGGCAQIRKVSLCLPLFQAGRSVQEPGTEQIGRGSLQVRAHTSRGRRGRVNSPPAIHCEDSGNYSEKAI